MDLVVGVLEAVRSDNRLIMFKFCKICSNELNESNWVKVSYGIRSRCKSCRSKQVMEYTKRNIEKRRIYMNKRARKIGKVKQYPCKMCNKLCYKKYALSFCSDICRFMNYVDSSSDCWIWKGAKNRRSYGKFSLTSKLVPAHRASYILFKGEIPEDKLVCHSCDNPSCVKPAHLWIGTFQDNSDDMVNKQRSLFGEKHIKAKLTLEGINKIRQLNSEGMTQRKIASLFEISPGHVNNIIMKRVWTHI